MEMGLRSAINAILDGIPEARLIETEEAETLRNRVAQRFGLPAAGHWWWEHLPSPVKSVGYGGRDGLEVILGALPAKTKEVFLFLTGDDAPPWECVQGTPDSTIRLLRELPFMEFFFVDESLEWILFDTHHNSVIGLGDQLRIGR